MYVSYEATIRMGAALMDYYKYAHSSGTFGAIGVCAGVGRIYGFSREKLNNAISVAEFNAPLVPGIRSVEYPSMNKDGVPFGVIVGALALIDTECGFEGCPHMLEAEEYRGYLDDLGVKHQVMDLYFKPYPCCRWAHPAIDACIGLISENGIDPCEIERVVIYTFNRATRLSKILPKTEDEAQYNIAYPVASAIVRGDFGLSEISEESYSDQAIIDMMARLSFETDPALDAKFPAKRICRAEITLKNGDVFRSPECEPRGEAHENIGADWLCDKFRRLTAPVICGQGQEEIISAIFGDVNISLRSLVDKVNSYLV
jgi:2-methylcitrate dehydratase PrpD